MSSAQTHLEENNMGEIYSAPIMIVEDNDVSRLFLEKILRGAGYTNLLAVDSAQQALDEFAKFEPELVILDIIMPGMDGFTCCSEMRKLNKGRHLPVLMQTVITEPSLRVKAFSMGATDFISKPVFPAELCARVRVHLERRLSMNNLQNFKSRVDMELSAARDLQLSIIPQTNEIDAVCKQEHLDIASLFKPSSEIGGDFWGMKPVAEKNQAFWLVDFSGHGVASAMNTFRLQAYLKEDNDAMHDPGQYLTVLNKKLQELLMRGHFATMFYGIVDIENNQLHYSCASAPHPILRSGKDGSTQLLDGSGCPLGIDKGEYHTKHIPFEPGDMLCLYSDALLETDYDEGDFIEEDEVSSWLARCPLGASANDIKNHVLEQFNDRIDTEVSDDLTLLIISRKAD